MCPTQIGGSALCAEEGRGREQVAPECPVAQRDDETNARQSHVIGNHGVRLPKVENVEAFFVLPARVRHDPEHLVEDESPAGKLAVGAVRHLHGEGVIASRRSPGQLPISISLNSYRGLVFFLSPSVYASHDGVFAKNL